jgi:hypothetical protein
MPPEYRYPSADFELWTPLYIPPDEIRHGMNNQYIAAGRLKIGVSLEQAQVEFSAMMRRLAEEYPDKYRAGSGWVGALVESLALSDAFQVRSALRVLPTFPWQLAQYWRYISLPEAGEVSLTEDFLICGGVWLKTIPQPSNPSMTAESRRCMFRPWK